MIGRWLICLAFVAVLGGCKRERRSALEPPTSPPRDAATLPIAPDPTPPPPAGDLLPAVVGPPKPLDVLRPQMKRVDAQAALAAAGARTSPSAPAWVEADPDATLYQTAIPTTLAHLRYDDADRLLSIEVQAEVLDTLLSPAIAAWGHRTPTGTAFLERTWSSTGPWSASLHSIDPEYRRIMKSPPTLSFTAGETPDATTAGDDLFVRITRVVGKPLEDADKHLGFAVRHETSDDDAGAAERTDARQGFATVRVAWSDVPWQLVLHTDARTKLVKAAVLAGGASQDPDRFALMAALKKAFGAPRPVVSDTGRFEIELGTSTLARALELDGRWSISVWKR